MTNIVQAKALLALFIQEKIETPENTSDLSKVRFKINLFRDVIDKTWAQTQPHPEMTKAIALTFLKLGACQELAMRVAVEYLSRFKTPNVSMVFTSNEQNEKENHCFTLIGQPIAGDGLIMRTGALAQKRFHVPIRQFLDQQSDNTAMADPLLNCAEAANGPCKPLMDYCSRNHITHVTGVFTFPKECIPLVPIIKDNAMCLSEVIAKLFKFD